jgi:cell division protease FtsH
MMYGGEQVSFSNETSRAIDSEIANLIHTNYEIAKKILNDNVDALHRVALALVVWETLDAEQIRNIVAGKDIGAPVLTKKPTDTPTPPAGTVVGANPMFGAGKPTPA